MSIWQQIKAFFGDFPPSNPPPAVQADVFPAEVAHTHVRSPRPEKSLFMRPRRGYRVQPKPSQKRIVPTPEPKKDTSGNDFLLGALTGAAVGHALSHTPSPSYTPTPTPSYDNDSSSSSSGSSYDGGFSGGGGDSGGGGSSGGFGD